MTETWKRIPSLPDFEASSEGRIRRGERILAAQVHRAPRGEYLRVQIWMDGKRTNKRVNRLVCEAFHGLPAEDLHARHIDGDAMNNRSGNLIWGTAHANFMDQVALGTAFLPPMPTELAIQRHTRKPTSIGQIKEANKIKMLARLAGGRQIRP